MSDLPFAWWDKTVTIYNKFVDPTTQKISWYRNTAENCFWKCSNVLFNMGRYGVSTLGVRIEDKEIICRIPKDDRYIDKRTWKELSDTERKDYFTFGNGDIIVLGEVADEIDEYVSGKRSTDLVAKYKEYDECLEISTYTINVYTGVTLEHYKITGK